MSRTQANLLLLLAALLWGFGNIAQKTVLEHLDPLSAVGLRCLIAGMLVAPLMRIERGQAFGTGWHISLAKVTVLFALSLAIQQVAYLSTSVTNASFLVNTATVMTPLIAWFLLHERPTLLIVLAACATLAGSMLMSGGLPGQASHGDLAAVLSAACYALWMVELGRHAKTFGRPFTTAAAQFLGAAAIVLPLGAMQGRLTLEAAIDAAPELMVLGIFSTAVAFGIQTFSQRFTTASHAAIIVSAESVFGAAAAAAFLAERPTVAVLTGASILLTAILAVAAFGQTNANPAGRYRRAMGTEP